MKKACKSNLPALIFLFTLLILWQLGAMKVNAAYILPTETPDRGGSYRTCLPVLRDERHGKDHGGEDFCQSGEL